MYVGSLPIAQLQDSRWWSCVSTMLIFSKKLRHTLQALNNCGSFAFRSC